MDWETLKNDCLACQRCPLHTTRHNVVFGQGVENAEVLFVGEGPGQSEDEQGLPFVGRSGQLLDKYHCTQRSPIAVSSSFVQTLPTGLCGLQRKKSFTFSAFSFSSKSATSM